MKVKNKSLANNSTISSFGVHEFNEHGCTDMNEEAANVLLNIPGFEKCTECQCAPPEVPEEIKEPKVSKAKKKTVEPAEPADPES